MDTPKLGPWAVVVNPSKFDDLDAAKAEVSAEASRHGWDAPRWYETSADDPGAQASRDAVADGAQLVVAMGGDGTVRFVAAELRGTDVRMGIVPSGTGNLLARNLEIPLDDVDAAIRIALTGDDHPIDVAVLHANGTDTPFVVAGGVGLDADIMVNTNEDVKKRFGWIAYIGGAAKSLLAKGFRAQTTIDGRALPRRHSRCVLVCNCPTITGGLEIALDGVMDDGQLDVVAMSPKGVFGWLSVGLDVLTRHRHGHGLVRQWQGREVSVKLDRPTRSEVDGDVLDDVTEFSVTLEPKALVVRVQPPEEPHYPTEETVEEQVEEN